MEWLCLTRNTFLFFISVPDRLIDDIVNCLQKTIRHSPNVLTRELAKVIGEIISLAPAMGNICNTMTKFCSMESSTKESWNSSLLFKYKD